MQEAEELRSKDFPDPCDQNSDNVPRCQRFIDEFLTITGLSPSFDDAYLAELNKLITYLRAQAIRPFAERRKEFLGHVNWKFRLNREPLANFYAEAAGSGVTFNYYQKVFIQRAFDLRDRERLSAVLDGCSISNKVKQHLLDFFKPIDERRTIDHLVDECRKPSKLRKEMGDRDIEGEIVKAHFSAFMWVSLKERDMHRFFDPNYSDEDYRESFWEQLHVAAPHLFSRDNPLHVVRIDKKVLRGFRNTKQIRGAISKTVERLYDVVGNHGFPHPPILPLIY